MKKIICDVCKKEFEYGVEQYYNPSEHAYNDSDLDLCENCYDKYKSAQEELKQAAEVLKNEFIEDKRKLESKYSEKIKQLEIYMINNLIIEGEQNVTNNSEE